MPGDHAPAELLAAMSSLLLSVRDAPLDLHAEGVDLTVTDVNPARR